MKRSKIFSDFFIFSIISLIARVKFVNIQIAIKSQPLGVEGWLSPFWICLDEYFHVAEEGVNLKKKFRPPLALKRIQDTLNHI